MVLSPYIRCPLCCSVGCILQLTGALKMKIPVHVSRLYAARTPLIFCLAALSVAAAAAQLSPDILLLSRIREKVKKNIALAGNCTCVETVARSSRKSEKGRLESIDTVQFEVAWIGGKELFSLPGERRFTQRPLDALVNLGMSAEGLFGSFVHALFSTNVATMVPAEESTSTGRRIVQYRFRFPGMMSHYTLTNAAGSARVAWSGSVWADADSLELVRLIVEADDIPVGLGIRSAVTEIDYGKYQLDTSMLQLPQTSTVTMTYWNGAMNVNRTDFSQCRAFSAASDVSFGETSSRAGELTDVPEEVFPADLTIRLRLDKMVQFEQATVGDAISATVETNVREHGTTRLTKGTTISGRIRRLEMLESPSEGVVIELEFSETSQQGTRRRFMGAIIASDFIKARVPKAKSTSAPRSDRSPQSLVNEFARSDVPGVATFLVRTKPYQIPAGFEMVWKSYRSKADKK
jgi:hypothetical protein